MLSGRHWLVNVWSRGRALMLATLTVAIGLAFTTTTFRSATALSKPQDASTAGFRLVASDGGIFSFGDANFHGPTGSIALNKPVVGMAATPSGHGYWLVASDGGIFSFGDANFYGSTGSGSVSKAIVGIAATPSGHGYWLASSGGAIFSFGDAGYFGSTISPAPKAPIVGASAEPSQPTAALSAPVPPAPVGPAPSPITTTPAPVDPNEPSFVPATAKLAYDGEFSGSSLNYAQWATCLPWWVSGQGCTNEGDQSQNWDLPTNDVVTPGNLSINMMKQNIRGIGPSGQPKEFNYTSGMVSTANRFVFSYGYVAIRAKVAPGVDVASAFCLFPASLAWPPEIDILEYSGSTPNGATFTYHAPDGTRPRLTPSLFSDLSGGWHTYGLAWTPGSIIWYVDNREVFSTNDDVSDVPMYLTLGVSVYSASALTPGASSMDISWARIWQ